jgi:hypothetical protein
VWFHPHTFIIAVSRINEPEQKKPTPGMKKNEIWVWFYPHI